MLLIVIRVAGGMRCARLALLQCFAVVVGFVEKGKAFFRVGLFFDGNVCVADFL